jgi:hypothetical protein
MNLFDAKKPACWVFWWLGAVLFACYSGMHYFQAASLHGYSSFIASQPYLHYWPDFAPGGDQYTAARLQWLAGAREVLEVGVFVSMVYFLMPILCWMKIKSRQRPPLG